MRGVFDDNIYNVIRGDKFIYEAVKEYFEANTLIEYEVKGRFNIIQDPVPPTTTTTTTTTTTSSSVTRLMSNSILICIGVMLRIWNQ